MFIKFYFSLAEFKNKYFYEFCSKEKIYHFFALNIEIKATLAERVIRTLKEKLFRYFTYDKTKRYVDVFPKIVENYNNTIHSVTKFKPNEVNKSNERQVFQNIYGNIKQKTRITKLNVDDHVRMQRLKNIFEKGYKQNWTNEIFKIKKILNTSPFPKYVVADKDDEIVFGSFYDQQLQKIPK